jgi:hypothetical protein
VKPPFAYGLYNVYIQRSKLVAIKAWCNAHPGEEYVFHVGSGEEFERQAKENPMRKFVFKVCTASKSWQCKSADIFAWTQIKTRFNL